MAWRVTLTCKIERVQYIRVRYDPFPESIRIDYESGFSVNAREWVCPDADGLIGEMGRRWWIERVGRVPANIEEALSLAHTLPVPEIIILEDSDEGRIILRTEYSAPLLTGNRIIDGETSLFYTDIDQLELDECRKSLTLGTIMANHHPRPAWWPRLNSIQKPLANSFDRKCISSKESSVIRKALTRSRQLATMSSGHLTYRQAVRNICMAYSIAIPPKPEEIALFFPSCLPMRDTIIIKHYDEFLKTVARTVTSKWLQKIIDPMIVAILKAPSRQREDYAECLGIGTDGQIKSGLAWTANGYFFEDYYIPCIDIEDALMSIDKQMELRDRKASLLQAFPSFQATLRKTLRECLDTTRIKLGLPRIGEGWVSETDLYHRVQSLLPGEQVLQHGRPKWLGRQHFDIWIPDRNVAIEYHGVQHFMEVKRFGGEAGLVDIKERDERKRMLCLKHGVTLIEIVFDHEFSDDWLLSRLQVK